MLYFKIYNAYLKRQMFILTRYFQKNQKLTSNLIITIIELKKYYLIQNV